MIEVASYHTLEEANAYAGVLRRAGIVCEVEAAIEHDDLDFEFEHEEEVFLIFVQPEDEDDARMIIDSAGTFVAPPNRPGQRDMLLGGVIGGIGILTSLADVPGVDAPWTWIPYGMAVLGVMLFLKGTKAEGETE